MKEIKKKYQLGASKEWHPQSRIIGRPLNLPTVKKTKTKHLNGSSFILGAVEMDKIDMLSLTYHQIARDPDLPIKPSRIIVAYRVGHLSGYHDNGDPALGHLTLGLMEEMSIHNMALFVITEFGEVDLEEGRFEVVATLFKELLE